MARFRLSGLAQADLTKILATSLERWGTAGRKRYAALLGAAMRAIAAEPEGTTTRERGDLLAGIRSFHIRHTHGEHRVGAPVHILYYRAVGSSLIEIVRILHERMDPNQHFRAVRRVRPKRRR